MAENFKKLYDEMSPEHQELAKETARLAIESIQRDTMLTKLECEIKEMQRQYNALQDLRKQFRLEREKEEAPEQLVCRIREAHFKELSEMYDRGFKNGCIASGGNPGEENKPKPLSQPLDEEREWEMGGDSKGTNDD